MVFVRSRLGPLIVYVSTLHDEGVVIRTLLIIIIMNYFYSDQDLFTSFKVKQETAKKLNQEKRVWEGTLKINNTKAEGSPKKTMS